MTPNKKYTYVLASSGSLSGSDSYTLYTGGTQMTHDGSDNGTFAMTGTLTKFTGVQELAGGSVTPTDDTVQRLWFTAAAASQRPTLPAVWFPTPRT